MRTLLEVLVGVEQVDAREQRLLGEVERAAILVQVALLARVERRLRLVVFEEETKVDRRRAQHQPMAENRRRQTVACVHETTIAAVPSREIRTKFGT